MIIWNTCNTWLEYLVDESEEDFKVCTATVSSILDPLLVLQPDDAGGKSLMVRYDSMRIFPVGWAHTNNLKVMVPRHFLPPKTESTSTAADVKNLKEGSHNAAMKRKCQKFG